MSCLYALLGAERDSSQDELRLAARKRVLETHPDKGGSGEAFQAVRAAFEVLSDPVRRQIYDRRTFGTASSPGKRALKRSRTDTEPEHEQACSHAVAKRRPKEGDEPSAERGRRYRDAHSPDPSKAQQPPREEKADATKVGEAATENQPQNKEASEAVKESRRMRTMLTRVYKKMQEFSPAERRVILEQKFSQSQRLRLERWLMSQRSTKPPGQEYVLSKRYDDDSSFDSEEYWSDESDLPPAEVDGVESGDYAHCDDAASDRHDGSAHAQVCSTPRSDAHLTPGHRNATGARRRPKIRISIDELLEQWTTLATKEARHQARRAAKERLRERQRARQAAKRATEEQLREERELRAARLRWCRRRDLTMEDLIVFSECMAG